MSGKHLCQSRLSATYISSNRYMHIILFYFRLFILFSPGLPFIGLHPSFIRLSSFFIRPSFSLPSSFPHPSSGLVPAFLHLSSFFTLHPAFLLPFHWSLSASSPSFPLLAPHHSSSYPSSFPALIPRHSRLDRESLSFPLLSPLSFQLASPRLLQRSPSPPFPLLPPSFQFSPSSFQLLSSSSFPARPGIPCHPEPVLLVILSASEGSSPTDFSIIISKHTKI